MTLIGLTGGMPRYNPYEALAAKLVLAVDWRRDDLVTVSGSPPKASSILDVISGANFAQATGGSQPGYAPPGGFTFDGLDDQSTLASTPMPTGSSPWYMAGIVDQQDVGSNNVNRGAASWGSGTTTNNQVRLFRTVSGGQNRLTLFVGSGAASPNAGIAGFDGKCVVEAWYDGSTAYVALNGGAPASVAVAASIGTTRTRIGGNASNTPGGPWLGSIFLKHWFNALLTTDERAEYVAHLLDLVSTLP